MASEPLPIGGAAAIEAGRAPPFRDAAPARPTPAAALPRALDNSAEHALILSLLASALDGVSRPMPGGAERIDWEVFTGIAARGRLLVQVQRGLAVSGIAAPDGVHRAIKAFRQRALMINSVNLSTVQRVAAALDAARIGFVVLKGPLQLRALYDDYFARPSSDLDLLVHRRDYDRAVGVLGQFGYAAADRCESVWWRHYLGEQHFPPPDRSLATVDLHHRVQQPGCPAPRNLGSYVDDAHRIALGSAGIPVLSTVHAALLASISFVKAVFHREHSARYLGDLAAQLLAMSDQERALLDGLAQAQAIRHLLDFAWTAAASLLPVDLPPPPLDRRLRRLSAEMLAAISLSPEDEAIVWPKRRHLLWHLCDPAGALGRPGIYAREAGFAAAAEISRLFAR